MSVELRLEPRQDVIALGNDAVVDVRIINGLPTSVRVPDPGMPGSRQPRFRLRAPDGKETAFAPADGRGVAPGASAPVVVLAPGEEASGDVSLKQFARLDKEGDYELSATLEFEGLQLAARPARIRVEETRIAEVAGFLARSADGEPAYGLVVLTSAGRLGTTPVREIDPRNGELSRMQPALGATAAGAERALGWTANYGIAFDPLRWMLAVSGSRLIAATNLSEHTATAGASSPVYLWLDGFVVKGHGLAVLAIAKAGSDSELMLFEGSAANDAPQLKDARPLARFSGTAAAAGAALAPTDSRILVAAAQAIGDQTRLLTWVVSNGAAVPGREFTIEGISTPLAVSVGWSATAGVRLSVLGRDSVGGTRVAELEIRSGSSQAGASKADAVDVGNVERAQMTYFEREPGVLSRAAVVRGPAGAFGVDAGNQVHPLQLPVKGAIALVPGRSRWYVLWPEGRRLASTSF